MPPLLHEHALWTWTDPLLGHRPIHQEGGEQTLTFPGRVLADSTQFDSRKGATWHCIVGRNFGSFVTHGTRPSTLAVISD